MRRFRPSPALVVAVMALVAALAGSAVAQQATTSVSKKKTKKIANKQANKQIDKRLPIGASELGSISESSETSPPAATPPVTATATCPDGSKVVSGGFEATPLTAATGVIVNKSERSNNGWTADGVALAAGNTITAKAYCLTEDG